MSGTSFVKICLLEQNIQYIVNSELTVISPFNLVFPFYFSRKSIKIIKNALNSYLAYKLLFMCEGRRLTAKQNEDAYVYHMGDKMLSLNKQHTCWKTKYLSFKFNYLDIRRYLSYKSWKT